MTNKSAAGVRATIEALIDAGIHGDVSGLDRIYHCDMQIQMLDISGDLARFDKSQFMTMLAESVQGTKPEDHKWARFNAVDAIEDRGHVLITRRVPIGDQNKVLELSIDLVFEDERWQVTREVIFARPDTEPLSQTVSKIQKDQIQ